MISISETKRNHMGQGLGNTGWAGGGERGGGKTVTFSFFKNAVTIAELCAGALSCRRRTCLKPAAGRRFS